MVLQDCYIMLYFIIIEQFCHLTKLLYYAILYHYRTILSFDQKEEKMSKKNAVLFVWMLAVCAAPADSSIAGFWLGLWHGMIAPITFIISLLSKANGVSFYEVHNNGGWYQSGFVLGWYLFCFVLALAPTVLRLLFSRGRKAS